MTFEQLFNERLVELLASRDTFDEAIESLQDAMPEMDGGNDRSQVYQWLGTLHLSLATDALHHGIVHEAQAQFALVEEYQTKSIEEDSSRMEPRLNLARYYLTFGMKPEEAIGVLTIAEGDRQAASGELALIFEHQRLSLLGVAHTLAGDQQQAAIVLDRAYSDDFKGKIPPKAVDVPSLQYLAARGVKLTPASAQAIVQRVRDFGVPEESIPDGLAEQLSM